MNRRHLLTAASVIAPAALLAGCGIVSTTSTGGVTTVTIDVAKLDELTVALTSGAKTLLANPLIAAAMGLAADAAAQVILTSVAAAVAQIDAQAGGKQVLTFSASSVPAAVASLSADVAALFKDAQAGVAGAGTAIGSNVMQVYDAFQTVVALIQVMIPSPLVGAAKVGAKMVMPEAQALAILG
ncbi:MAG TPA: hypothetical protein PK677_11155 [Acidiphilium sp.]|nr:hypothetical protein [Acidiphilium sp.]